MCNAMHRHTLALEAKPSKLRQIRSCVGTEEGTWSRLEGVYVFSCFGVQASRCNFYCSDSFLDNGTKGTTRYVLGPL